jgi:hypothetical protein
MDYARYAQDMREALFQKHYEGATSEDLMEFMDGHRRELASSMLPGMFNNGSIGRSGLDGLADRNAAAFAYHSNQGNLDLRYGQRTMDARMPDQATPLTVGGDKAEQVMIQAAEHNMDWANKELEIKGIQMTRFYPELDSHGDRTGVIRYVGSDGNVYRVNATAENGRRFIERLEDGRWVDIKDLQLPDVKPNDPIDRFWRSLNWRQAGPDLAPYLNNQSGGQR